jgi:hypothetical protein
MPRLTNRTRETIDFIVKGNAKDGVPPTESLAPGETRNIDAIENATYRGRLASGLVTLEVRGHAAAAKE